MERYDVIVIGGGHAGTEAAALSARRGARTLLLTQSLDTIGQMSCNPAIGGIAKGTVVREVDALGGIMGRATDLARIQFRMLNRSKGPAVWSPRAQCDRGLYRRAVRQLLEQLPSLEFRQDTVTGLQLSGDRVNGVTTRSGLHYRAAAVVMTTGTFLRGKIHQGLGSGIPAGRAGDPAAVEIVEAIESVGLKTSRFKTGTPPRVDGRTVDLASLRVQHGDSDPFWFSFYERASHPAQLPCYLTYTGPRLKEIIQEHLGESALYGGEISGRGPRYCPSIEDKIVKFPRAERHQVFLEPEGLETTEMYVNGLSTSLPVPVQLEFLRTVPGLEYVRMTRPGYAIEYDYFPPQQLEPTLESKVIRGIFFAGQVNGTTGYEEAAGQGALAGINAAGLALGHEQIQLSRGESYIGVLVDDLISRGVDEPYRLFTSRSEYRLLLRQDNALRRLYPLIRRLNLLGRDEEGLAEQQMRSEEEILEYARTTTISRSAANEVLARFGSADVSEPIRIADLARRPGVSLSVLLTAAGAPLDPANADWAEIELKYAGYLQRERASAEKLNQMEDFSLPENFDYTRVQSISYEAREKLQRQQPRSLGQASRIPGVSPCDLQNLIGAVLRVRAPSPGSFM